MSTLTQSLIVVAILAASAAGFGIYIHLPHHRTPLPPPDKRSAGTFARECVSRERDFEWCHRYMKEVEGYFDQMANSPSETFDAVVVRYDLPTFREAQRLDAEREAQLARQGGCRARW